MFIPTKDYNVLEKYKFYIILVVTLIMLGPFLKMIYVDWSIDSNYSNLQITKVPIFTYPITIVHRHIYLNPSIVSTQSYLTQKIWIHQKSSKNSTE